MSAANELTPAQRADLRTVAAMIIPARARVIDDIVHGLTVAFMG